MLYRQNTAKSNREKLSPRQSNRVLSAFDSDTVAYSEGAGCVLTNMARAARACMGYVAELHDHKLMQR